jgi:hypothetical protein
VTSREISKTKKAKTRAEPPPLNFSAETQWRSGLSQGVGTSAWRSSLCAALITRLSCQPNRLTEWKAPYRQVAVASASDCEAACANATDQRPQTSR